MWLHKVKTPAVHGVDYHKGLEDGRVCLRVHEYETKHCRPVLYTDEQKESWHYKSNEWVDYESLTEREKLILGEPIFFNSSNFRAMDKDYRNEVTK